MSAQMHHAEEAAGEQQSLIDELETAVASGSSGQHAATVRRIVDLFLSSAIRYSDEQIALFDDVIARLARDIEVAARAELSARLAPLTRAPPNVIRMFAFDVAIEVAGPVLRQSPCLDEATLVDVATRMRQSHLLALSQRDTLSPPVTDILVDRGDRHVLGSVAANKGARFSDTGFSELVKRSQGDDDLAAAVGLRSDLPRHLFLRLLAKASDVVRMKLEESYSQHARVVQGAVATAANRLSAAEAAQSRDYQAAESRIAELQAKQKLDGAALAAFAEAGEFEATAIGLAVLSGVSVGIVERALLQERPETLMILAKAAGFPWPIVKCLIRSFGRAVTLLEMDRCLTSYQRLRQPTALQIVRLPSFTATH